MCRKRSSEVPVTRAVLNDSFRFLASGLATLFTNTVFNFVEGSEMLMRIRPLQHMRRSRRPRMRSAPLSVTRARQRRTPKSDARQTLAIKKR